MLLGSENPFQHVWGTTIGLLGARRMPPVVGFVEV
jgi:hypothetical protein